MTIDASTMSTSVNTCRLHDVARLADEAAKGWQEMRSTLCFLSIHRPTVKVKGTCRMRELRKRAMPSML